jgi:hypothetical protein
MAARQVLAAILTTGQLAPLHRERSQDQASLIGTSDIVVGLSLLTHREGHPQLAEPIFLTDLNEPVRIKL